MPLEGFVRTSLAAEQLLALAVAVTSERHVASVLQGMVRVGVTVFLNPCRLAGFAYESD
jgi:hypothetical protein